ncbi:MAG TPA: hypothetical protein VF629_06275 [Hymenobacter sp.]
MSVYQHIAQRASKAPVRQRCHVLQAAPGAYYAWHPPAAGTTGS